MNCATGSVLRHQLFHLSRITEWGSYTDVALGNCSRCIADRLQCIVALFTHLVVVKDNNSFQFLKKWKHSQPLLFPHQTGTYGMNCEKGGLIEALSALDRILTEIIFPNL